MLETTRCYALEKLRESGEFDTVARRHAEGCQDLLQQVAAESRSDESSNREQRKPILHIAPSRHRPAFSDRQEHESENARPF
jgi:predicted ATPase